MQLDSMQILIFPTPTGSLSDQMLPLFVSKKQQSVQLTPNLDILLSKYLNNDQLNDIELQQLNQSQRLAMQNVKIRNKHAKKRPDQYQKSFFKRAFKYAEKEYFGKSKNKSRKMSLFYHHHFETVAQKMGIPLINFYHPDKKTKPGMRTGQKSFNLSYIRLLLRSDSFRQVSRLYYNRFKQQCIAQRRIKIPKFVSYIKGLINKYGRHPQKMIELIKSSKCKVPWTNQEIEEADRRALEELDKVIVQSCEEVKQEAVEFQEEGCSSEESHND